MTDRQDQHPQDKPWNEAQFSQAQQGQSQHAQGQQAQSQDGQQQGLANQQLQDHAGISQHGSSEVSGLSPQADASPATTSFPSSAGQQGAGSASAGRQEHQFDSQGGGQFGGGSGSGAGNFADQIQPHAEIVDDSGTMIGTVDRVEGDRIKLSRRDASDAEHHYVSLSQVAGIEGGRVRLRERGDNDYGMEAG